MLELRKSYNQKKGEMMIELLSFSLEGEQEHMGKFNVANFKGKEVEHLFNNNLECIFNHMMVKNNLYFFSIENSGSDERNINLNSFEIKDNHKLRSDTVVVK